MSKFIRLEVSNQDNETNDVLVKCHGVEKYQDLKEIVEYCEHFEFERKPVTQTFAKKLPLFEANINWCLDQWEADFLMKYSIQDLCRMIKNCEYLELKILHDLFCARVA